MELLSRPLNGYVHRPLGTASFTGSQMAVVYFGFPQEAPAQHWPCSPLRLTNHLRLIPAHLATVPHIVCAMLLFVACMSCGSIRIVRASVTQLHGGNQWRLCFTLTDESK